MPNDVGLPKVIPEPKLEEWMPMPPNMGPPLPRLLGIYWPWYEAVPPGVEFRVNNLVITPTEVNPGQTVTISATVTNIGTEAGSYTVKLGGDFMAEQMVTLAPGESTTVSFDVVPEEVKAYHVTVDSLSGTFTATEKPVADIRVENLVIEPTECYVGDTVTISVTATNYGAAAGTKRIVCTVT